MPMSHRDLREKIRRETKGRPPSEELRILDGYLKDWPEYKGPYQELRKKYEARIEELRRVLDVRAEHRRSRDPFAIRKRGLASVALVGLPNSGKSTLASSLSRLEVETAAYPYSTLTPNVVMMKLGSVVFELLDLPPVAEQPLDGLSYAGGLTEAIRNATLLGLVVDLQSDVAESVRTLEERLEETGVRAVSEPPEGEGQCDAAERGAMFFATRFDLAGEPALRALKELRPRAAVVEHPLACDGRLRAGEALCRLLRMMLVTARDPAAPEEPVLYAVPEGAAVMDLADRIHHELANRVKKARVWGDSAAFEGQEVGLEHRLMPGDIVELH